MKKSKRNMVLEILKYWKIIEFLNQKDIPNLNLKRQKIDNKKDKIEIFVTLNSSDFDVTNQLNDDANKYSEYKVVEESISYCIGKIKRNTIVECLKNLTNNKDKFIETEYNDQNAIAWFSFKTDKKGFYLKNSFQLSPILWALSIWIQSKKKKKNDFNLDKAQYDGIISKVDKKLQGSNVTQFLKGLYDNICYDYICNLFPEMAKQNEIGFIEYNRYLNEDIKNKSENLIDYSDLGKSFFLNDIIQLENLIRRNNFGDRNAYEKKVIEYILAGYEKSIENKKIKRYIISPEEPTEKMKSFFEKTLNVAEAPMGKWPARFMPALMQQVAVNLAIKQNDDAPIFSVNGPPGTGKTTLLKEIVASNIVDRAKILADYDGAPDDFFTGHKFSKGSSEDNSYYECAPAYYSIKNDLINNYSILVASCNNAAVENITVDLPNGNDILESLKTYSDDDNMVKSGLQEVHDLFNINKTQDIETITKYGETSEIKDIYFTRYANNLLKKNDCWGLVSAPLGKRSNIRKYCQDVLNPFVEEYKSENSRKFHEKKYAEAKKQFLQQFALVDKLQKELKDISAIKKKKCIIGSLLSKLKKCGVEEDQAKFIKYSQGKKKMTPIDAEFMKKYASADIEKSTNAQITNPWFTAEYNREREKLFLYACKLHKEFVLSSECMKQNIVNLMIAWGMYDDCKERMKQVDRKAAMPYMLQSLFLLTPVISTTFAAAQTFLGDISKSGVLGTLIVDEAGQAQPQMVLGTMFRCRKAIIVGDPKQIEPVVTDESDMIKQLFTSNLLTNYKDKKISVQGFADYINPYGTFLGEDNEKEWVGCPLVVHRRCIDPMYAISNALSYGGTMKQQTGAPKEELAKRFILDKSYWIDVIGSENSGAKDHFVNAQGEIVLKLLATKFRKDSSDIPKLFIITPFTSVKAGMINTIRNSDLYRNEPRVKKWLDDNNVGTVHTFQGKGADEVIFLLGCDNKSIGAVNWVNKNIVNVAVTRAKFRLYMIGDQNVWNCGPIKFARKYIPDIISENNLDVLLENTLNDQGESNSSN